ncbi:hypothetical protein NQ318_019933 [Aromia moschata]|uniref:Polycomb-like MTF2 factor 2 C-terminal domain-containing protein n=1 Tax=Aromia moschata TaxID=1265417 RepID=A0AAV8Y7W8_9CUCU|nr:hypothetical protein NQ318_019933 [Aromia moschata]
MDDLKTSVNIYFGAANRIAAGERFGVKAKRTGPTGKMEYLIEWGGPQQRDDLICDPLRARGGSLAARDPFRFGAVGTGRAGLGGVSGFHGATDLEGVAALRGGVVEWVAFNQLLMGPIGPLYGGMQNLI